MGGVGRRPVARSAIQVSRIQEFYNNADIRIDTDRKSVEDIAAEILEYLRGLAA
jgi:regulator of PEP synthase PpsR (kinase-PPPase family)